MISLFSWLTRTYHGSNRISYWLRKRIERLPLQGLIGVQLTGVAFFAAFIVPQFDQIQTNLSLRNVTNQTPIDVIPSEEKFQWPLSRFVLSQNFSVVHPGIDLATAIGTPVYPASEGKVIETNHLSWGYGNYILVDHGSGIYSRYAHLSTITARVGDTVSKKAAIGHIGITGWSSGPHLHFEIYQDHLPMSPLEVLPALPPKPTSEFLTVKLAKDHGQP